MTKKMSNAPEQDMKSIYEGGTLLDQTRYPEADLFCHLWVTGFEFQSVAEIAADYTALLDEMRASCKISHPHATKTVPVYSQALVEECLNKLSVFGLLETTCDNGVTKYRMNHAKTKSLRAVPYVNKLIELMD